MPGIYNETGKGPYRQSVPVWKGADVVSPGDFVYRDSSGYDRAATNFTWDTDIATTSSQFRTAFRGVSMAKRIAAQTLDGGRNHGLILATGEFQNFLSATATAIQSVGSFVSVAKASGNNLENQKITLTATISNAIGRLTQDVRIGDIVGVWEIRPVRGGTDDGVLSYYDNSQTQTIGVTASAPTA